MLLFLHVLAIALGADWIPCYFYSMDGNSRHQVIKRLQAGLPRGAPFDLATLSQFGVSPQLAAHYADGGRSEEHTSELKSLMRISYAVFCLKTNHTRLNRLHTSTQTS